MIRDQRSMMGTYHVQTVEEIRAAWAHAIERIAAARGESLALHDTGETLAAYVNQNRWVADCPECNGGIPGWPDHDQGACLDCGGVYNLTFPDDDTIAKADVVLADRRGDHTRNWFPARETIADLQCENVLMEGADPLSTPEVPATFGGFVEDGRRLAPGELTARYSRVLQARHQAALERVPRRSLERGR